MAPPDLQDAAVQTVLQEGEVLSGSRPATSDLPEFEVCPDTGHHFMPR